MVEGNLHDTIVHETTHQVAFNTGLHSRIGQTPKWVIEGLATMFEAPGIRDSQKSSSPKSRINRSRYVWFGNYMQSRRKPHSLADFVGDGRPLRFGHARRLLGRLGFDVFSRGNSACLLRALFEIDRPAQSA